MRLWLVAGVAALLGCATAHAQAPTLSNEVRKQLGAALEANDKPAVTRAAHMLACMGASLSDASFERVAPLLDETLLAGEPPCAPKAQGTPIETLHWQFRHNANGNGAASEPFAEVPAEYRLVEGVTWDYPTRRLFIGTVIEGRLAYLEKGEWHEIVLGNPRGGLFGMQIDRARRLLWIATGSVDQTAIAGERLSGLIAVDLDRLTVAQRIPLPAGTPGAPGDVTFGADGTVFVSNSVSGAIHRCKPGCKTLEDLVPAGTFKSPQGMVVSGDGKRLYVADYSTGLWAIGLHEPKMWRLAVDHPMMLEGIDGLLPGYGGLVAIQNGSRPRRIIQIRVKPDGTGIESYRLGITVPADGGEPTLGTFANYTLLYVADSQWERYGPGGAITDGQPPRPTPIRKTGFGRPPVALR